MEIYKALTEVKVACYFEGSNLVLQLWMIEHLDFPTLSKINLVDHYLRDRVEFIEHKM